MNNMKINKIYSTAFLFVSLLFFNGCEDHQLKPPRKSGGETSRQTGESVLPVDREFARELARELGREFARELSRQLNEGNSSIQLDSVFSASSVQIGRDPG